MEEKLFSVGAGADTGSGAGSIYALGGASGGFQPLRIRSPGNSHFPSSSGILYPLPHFFWFEHSYIRQPPSIPLLMSLAPQWQTRAKKEKTEKKTEKKEEKK